ncbi:hypothetical protein [Saccharopolyspora shandongensis]|uniref:hypothetical protein n=1 Tax=Saccharopolyspora shandongensis TaxID=418495 RepID=UPI00340A317E
MARGGGRFLDLSEGEREMKRLGQVLKNFEDGKDLRKQMTREIRQTANPVRQEARAAIRSMPSKGGYRKGRPLRAAIAQKIQIASRPTGRFVGVKITAGQTGSVRGFTHAARKTNFGRWRHPVFGDSANWVSQNGEPGWFDNTMLRNRPTFRRAVRAVLEDYANRIARRI